MNQDFKKGIEWLFNHCNTSYSLRDTIEVFELFFAAYEHFTEEKHPVINVGQIKNIIENMIKLQRMDIVEYVSFNARRYLN